MDSFTTTRKRMNRAELGWIAHMREGVLTRARQQGAPPEAIDKARERLEQARRIASTPHATYHEEQTP